MKISCCVFYKFGAKVPISIDFVNYFTIYLQNKKASTALDLTKSSFKYYIAKEPLLCHIERSRDTSVKSSGVETLSYRAKSRCFLYLNPYKHPPNPLQRGNTY